MPQTLTETLRARLFNSADHPYRILERSVGELLRHDHTLLDAGCGKSMELVHRFSGKVRQAIGVDLCDLSHLANDGHCRYLQCDLSAIQLESESVDVILSRSVMEHLQRPELVYAELHRLLKPGGYFVFLTPNLWDYGSMIAQLIPNRFHPFIVAKTEGRKESDTFPTCYRSNTGSAIRRLAGNSGFELVSLRYLSQYPNYLQFNAFLFMIGSLYAKVTEKTSWLAYLRPWILATLRKLPARRVVTVTEASTEAAR